jgi:MscS family membrane protein
MELWEVSFREGLVRVWAFREATRALKVAERSPIVMHLRVVATLLLCVVCAASVAGQVSSLLNPQTPAKPAKPPNVIDPLGLGRETPRGALVGFVKAAQNQSPTAAEYFQPLPKGRRVSTEEEEEIADHLLTVINTRFPAYALSQISSEEDGRGDDQIPRDQITVAGTRSGNESFSLTLVREDDLHNTKLWFISRQTLNEVPEIYDSLQYPRLEKMLPTYLVKRRLVGMPAWQWVAIILFAPVAMILGWALALLMRTLFGRYRRYRKLHELTPKPLRHFGPGAMLLAVLIHYDFVYKIGASLLYRQYYQRVVLILFAIAAYWAITRVTHWIFRDIALRLTERGRLAERSLISLSRRVLDVMIFLVISLWVLSAMDVNVTAALAGLGIGGLAIGLGAQKTFENLLGGISILTDKAIVVGDTCKIGDRTGTVEDIGLRSTRIRTEERTVVSIPNGTVATSTVENFKFRDKILCKQLVRLRYDLSPDHLRYVLEQIREVLARNPKIEASTSRVRVMRFGENAIEVEIYAYVLERDFGLFLATQESLLLDVMDTLERTGGAVALPSQTTMVTQDSWVDPEKAAAAKRALEKGRGPDGSNR